MALGMAGGCLVWVRVQGSHEDEATDMAIDRRSREEMGAGERQSSVVSCESQRVTLAAAWACPHFMLILPVQVWGDSGGGVR
jgi:hypothetical protein